MIGKVTYSSAANSERWKLSKRLDESTGGRHLRQELKSSTTDGIYRYQVILPFCNEYCTQCIEGGIWNLHQYCLDGHVITYVNNGSLNKVASTGAANVSRKSSFRNQLKIIVSYTDACGTELSSGFSVAWVNDSIEDMIYLHFLSPYSWSSHDSFVRVKRLVLKHGTALPLHGERSVEGPDTRDRGKIQVDHAEVYSSTKAQLKVILQAADFCQESEPALFISFRFLVQECTSLCKTFETCIRVTRPAGLIYIC